MYRHYFVIMYPHYPQTLEAESSSSSNEDPFEYLPLAKRGRKRKICGINMEASAIREVSTNTKHPMYVDVDSFLYQFERRFQSNDMFKCRCYYFHGNPVGMAVAHLNKKEGELRSMPHKCSTDQLPACVCGGRGYLRGFLSG